MSDESRLLKVTPGSSLSLLKTRSGLIGRGRRDAQVILSTRTIELPDTEEEGHFGFRLSWKDATLWFLAGPHEIQLDIEDARKLAAFLIRGCADLVWDSPTPVSVGQQWCLYAARDVSDVYPHARDRDVPRRRVRVHCGNCKWHLLPYEMDRLGTLFREALR